jgi:cobaltochelatase CobN
LFYRAHYLAGNLAPIDALCESLRQCQIEPVPIYIYSLQDPNLAADLDHYFKSPGTAIDILLNTTSFSLIKPNKLIIRQTLISPNQNRIKEMCGDR